MYIYTYVYIYLQSSFLFPAICQSRDEGVVREHIGLDPAPVRAWDIASFVGLFCGYVGLFCRNVGLFCGYVGLLIKSVMRVLYVSMSVLIPRQFVGTASLEMSHITWYVTHGLTWCVRSAKEPYISAKEPYIKSRICRALLRMCGALLRICRALLRMCGALLQIADM